MKLETVYGDRSQRHHDIMTMALEDLHENHPFVQDITFNETMLKKEFNEKNVPDSSCLFGVKENGKEHRFVIGNEQGEILPKLLFAKFKMIESGQAFGKEITITIDDEQRDNSKYYDIALFQWLVFRSFTNVAIR